MVLLLQVENSHTPSRNRRLIMAHPSLEEVTIAHGIFSSTTADLTRTTLRRVSNSASDCVSCSPPLPDEDKD
jgi:hypothetical protein